MSREVPEGWQELGLAPHVDLLPGLAFKSDSFSDDPDGRLPLIRIRDLADQQPGIYVPADFDSRFLIRDGDFLVGMDGEFTAVRWQGGDAALNQRVMKFRSASADLDSEFLFYRLQPELRRLEQTISATTVKHLAAKHIRELRWAVPPLAEQRRIAEILSSVDEAIQAAQAVVEQSAKIRAAVVDSLIEQSAKDFGCLTLAEAGGTVIDGDRGSEYPKQIDFSTSGYCLFLSAQNVTKAGFAFDNCQFISSERHHKMRSGILQRNDVVITTRGTIGNIALYDEKVGFDVVRINSGMAILRADPSKLSPSYLHCVLGSGFIERQITRLAFGSAQPQITLGILRGLHIPVPPKSQQERIADQDIKITEVLRAGRRHVEQLKVFKGLLMSDLLTGRKRVTSDLPLAAE